MKANWSRIVLAGCLALFFSACNQDQVVAFALPNERLPQAAANLLVASAQTGPVVPPPTQEPKKDGTQMAPPTVAGSPPGLESLIEKAKDDLAQRLFISAAQISLVEAKEVFWPDSSLGCPQPGMRYIQVPEDGALIILRAQGKVYEYHNGGRHGLFLCEKIYKDPKVPPKLNINK